MRRNCNALAITILVLLNSRVWSATYHVPDQYATIQAAIEAAADGDTVVVARGRYEEILDFKGKTITVTGTDPEDWAVVQATVVDAMEKGTVVRRRK